MYRKKLTLIHINKIENWYILLDFWTFQKQIKYFIRHLVAKKKSKDCIYKPSLTMPKKKSAKNFPVIFTERCCCKILFIFIKILKKKKHFLFKAIHTSLGHDKIPLEVRDGHLRCIDIQCHFYQDAKSQKNCHDVNQW